MPTVLREDGFEVRIYTFDHPPPHVHVAKAGAIVRIDLGTHGATDDRWNDFRQGCETSRATRDAARETSEGRMDKDS